MFSKILNLTIMIAVLSACKPTAEKSLEVKEKNEQVSTAEVKVQQEEIIKGPLGLAKGISVEQLKKYGDFEFTKNKYILSAKNIKHGHTDFEMYLATVTPEQGLCKVTAITKEISTSVYGLELKAKFDYFSDALIKKYDKPQEAVNKIANGSIWSQPEDWMMGLKKKERALLSMWDSKERKLPDSLDVIALQAVATSVEKGFFKLSYEFDNYDTCYKVIVDKANKNL